MAKAVELEFKILFFLYSIQTKIQKKESLLVGRKLRRYFSQILSNFTQIRQEDFFEKIFLMYLRPISQISPSKNIKKIFCSIQVLQHKTVQYTFVICILKIMYVSHTYVQSTCLLPNKNIYTSTQIRQDRSSEDMIKMNMIKNGRFLEISCIVLSVLMENV